jgi:hypothetical protein
MDNKTVKKHSITLREIKKAAVMVVGQNNAISYHLKLEKDKYNSNSVLFHFKLTLTVYGKNRTANIKYEYFADTKKQLIINMLNLNGPDELEHCFEPFCF